MGHAGQDNFVCLNCGAVWGHRGKCDHCGADLKADRLLTESDWDQLMDLAAAKAEQRTKETKR